MPIGHCILVVGDSIIDNGTQDSLKPKYDEKLKEYKASGGRWTLEPTIWKCIKEPKKKK